MFNSFETAACLRLVKWALEEDLGAEGDATSVAVIPEDLEGAAVFATRAEGVVAGLPAVAVVLAAVDQNLKWTPHLADGTRLKRGDILGRVAGTMRSLLGAERLALNFLQHLCGIATLTRLYVDAVAGCPAKILDTRKTIPGWRLLEKYAVRCGGGQNHRMGLFDGILIKDNHLAAIACGSADISQVVHSVRKARGKSLPLEIEVDTLEQLDQALGCGPDIILLDNMVPGQLREAVHRREQKAPGVLLEASGGISLETVRAVAESGVDRISVGALTHSAPALDIGLDYSFSS